MRSEDGTLRAESLKFRYFEKSERNILSDLSLEFPGGSVTVILGGSGCGKSTLAAVLCGLYPENGGYLEHGSVSVGGVDILSLPFGKRCSYIAAMFQNPDLQFCMSTLRSELLFCLENIKTPPEDMARIAADAAERYGSVRLLDREFSTLSGGEKQIAALTCLFVLHPRVLVLDEPFASLDPDSTRAYIALLKKRISEERLTVIAIDHKASNWLDTADYFLPLDGTCRPAASETLIPADRLRDNGALLGKLGIENPFDELAKKPPRNFAGEPVLSVAGADIYHTKKMKKHKNAPPQLGGVSVSARRGEMIACLGASGSGKTTFLLTLLKQKFYNGSIELHGSELRQINNRQLYKFVGIVFQNPSLQFVTTSVQKEIEESLRLRGASENIKEKAIEILEAGGLRHYRRYSPFMLSQGQQRRLAVLAMLAGGQDVLLLDEPTYGQDERTTRALMELVCSRAEDGTTVIFTTHDRRLALRYADRALYFSRGTVRELSPEQLRALCAREGGATC